MQTLTAILLAYGGLLVGYGSPLITYLILRRKARKESAGRPIIHIQWWKSFCWFLSAAFFMGAALWTVTIAQLFANLVLSLDEICPSLIAQDECYSAALDWQELCVVVGEVAFTALFITVCTILREVKRTSLPEYSYTLPILTSSHCLLVVSWLLCTPLTYPLRLFSLSGTDRWKSVSLSFALVAVLTYIVGTTLWIIALIKVFYAWRRTSRDRTSAGAQWPGGPETDIVLQDV